MYTDDLPLISPLFQYVRQPSLPPPLLLFTSSFPWKDATANDVTGGGKRGKWRGDGGGEGEGETEEAEGAGERERS